MYIASMDLEKAYDRVCREELWRVLDECGVKEYLVIGMKSPYERSGVVTSKHW